MIDWSEVAPALRTLISSLATASPATPSFEGRWADKKAEFVHPGVQRELVLRIMRVRDVYADQLYETVTVTPDDVEAFQVLEERVYGMKEFVLEVRVDSYEHSEDESRWSWSMAERIRTGLHFERANTALQAVNVALVSIGDARPFTFNHDKRVINCAIFEVTMNAAFTIADPVPTNWFERVVLTSEIRNPADVLLTSPPNITNVMVPPRPPEPDPDPEP